MRHLVQSSSLEDRVTLRVGWLPEEDKVDLFASCLAAVYCPFDEDSYGYPSLEAHQSNKAVVSCTDAGGVSELVVDGLNGFLVEPDAACARGTLRRAVRGPGPRRRHGRGRRPADAGARHLLGPRDRSDAGMTRIAMVTSIDRRSAIARAALRTAATLAESVDVTVFAEPTSHPLRCPLPLRTIDDGALHAHDHVIVELGDSPFHVQSFWAARRVPSIVILHDVLLAHLVAACMSLDDVRSELTRWYGPERAAVAMRGAGTARPAWDGPGALDVPLFEPALEHATGVVVHSTFARCHVEAGCLAPVRVVPLAYEAVWEAVAPEPPPSAPSRTLLTLGHANANKCHELVIEAVAELDDPSVRYVIAGDISAQRRERLRGLAAAFGVDRQVEVLGAVSDRRAAELIAAASVCVNLRRPTIEGGSASLVEQMAAGRCVVVFDQGCYADAPDDTVVKLPAATGPVDLARGLGALLADPDRRARIGEAARTHAREVHSFDAYAASVLGFLDEVGAAEPHLSLAHRVAEQTRSWGMQPGSPLAGRWAAAITATTASQRAAAPFPD